MDLVRILHVVDMQSLGKRDLTIFILLVWYSPYWSIWIKSLFESVHLDFLSSLVFIQCSCFGMVLVYCSKSVGLCHPFLTVCFLSIFSDTRCCSVSVDLCGFPSCFWHSRMTMVWTDHPVVVHTENVYIEAYIH